MLNPLSIQNLQSSTGKSLSAAELVRALPLNTPTTITVQQSQPNPAQPQQFLLQVQLGSQLYQLKSNQALPQGSQATLTRTAEGKLLMTPQGIQAQPAQQASPTNQTPQVPTAQPNPQSPQATQTQANPQVAQQARPLAGSQVLQQPLTQSSQPTTQPGQPQPGSQISQPAQTPTPQTSQQPSQQTSPQTQIGLQPLSQPATTQNKPIQQTNAAAQTGQGQQLAPDQKPIVQITARQPQSQAPQSPPQPAPQQTPQPATQQAIPQPAVQPSRQTTPATTQQVSQQPLTAQLNPNLSAELTRILPVNRPVIAQLSLLVGTENAPNMAQANVSGRTLTLTLNQPLPFDGKVLLQRNPDGQVQIQPLTSPAQNQNLQQTINDTLRLTLPQQQPVADALNQLQQINRAAGGEKSPLNSVLSSLINLFAVKPNASEGQAIVKDNLLNGGLFTERNLTTPRTPIAQGEMKQQLSQLLQQADKLPELPRQQLQELVRNLMSRVTSNQLESIQNTRVSSDGGIERFFALDLPVRYGEQLDNVELKISEHRHQTGENEWQRLWRARLHFELGEQGTIDAELVLEEEHRITAHFWCSNGTTADELAESLPDFNRQLQQQGYHIEAVNCSEGSPPKQITKVEQLIDVST